MSRLTLLWYLMNAATVLTGVGSCCVKTVRGERLVHRAGDVVGGVLLIACGLFLAAVVWQAGGFR